jgi:hypothetical protein
MPMFCKLCGSGNRNQFMGEMGIRIPGLTNIDKAAVFIFPQIIVCLDCGFAEFVVPEAELRRLAKGAAAGSTRVSSSSRAIGKPEIF